LLKEIGRKTNYFIIHYFQAVIKEKNVLYSKAFMKNLDLVNIFSLLTIFN